MKDYSFIAFHRAIDSISEASAKVDKAKLQLTGAICTASCTDDENAQICEIFTDLSSIENNLKRIRKQILSLEK